MQTMEPPFAQRGEVRRKVAERPSQDPISRIRGLGVVTSGINDVQRGMFPENQSWVSVNLYSLIPSFVGVIVGFWLTGESECFRRTTLCAYHVLSLREGFLGVREQECYLWKLILDAQRMCRHSRPNTPPATLSEKWWGFQCVSATLSISVKALRFPERHVLPIGCPVLEGHPLV